MKKKYDSVLTYPFHSDQNHLNHFQEGSISRTLIIVNWIQVLPLSLSLSMLNITLFWKLSNALEAFGICGVCWESFCLSLTNLSIPYWQMRRHMVFTWYLHWKLQKVLQHSQNRNMMWRKAKREPNITKILSLHLCHYVIMSAFCVCV